jgi:hypothetical protein
MIDIDIEYARFNRPIRARCDDRVIFRDNPQNFRRIAFFIERNGHELLEISGSHAHDMLISFLNSASEFHLKQFMKGIQEELDIRESRRERKE